MKFNQHKPGCTASAGRAILVSEGVQCSGCWAMIVDHRPDPEPQAPAKKEKLPVVYRILQGDVIALFPTLPGSEIYTCTCYARIGQHSVADAYEFVTRSGPASKDEYASLHEELTGIYEEYELVVYKRIHHWMHEERIDEVRKLRAQ